MNTTPERHPAASIKEQKRSVSSSPSPGLEASRWADPEFASPTRPPKPVRARSASIKTVVPRPCIPEAIALTKESVIVETPQVPQPSATEEEEDREHLTHFKSWGTPMARDKPGMTYNYHILNTQLANIIMAILASEVRRIILSNLPPTFDVPAKVLTVVHGGAIESIRMSGSGSAHILFCDARACRAYYDKYPNGIHVGPGGRQTIFVDMGQEIDVVSSQLTLALSTGASRVIRCAGVDLKTSMSNLFEMASANNRKVEKIVDTYVSGEVCIHFPLIQTGPSYLFHI